MDAILSRYLSYNSADTHGKTEAAGIRTEVLGATGDLSKRIKRVKSSTNTAAAALDYAGTNGSSSTYEQQQQQQQQQQHTHGIPIHAYSTSSSASHLQQLAFPVSTLSSSSPSSSSAGGGNSSSNSSSSGGAGTASITSPGSSRGLGLGFSSSLAGSSHSHLASYMADTDSHPGGSNVGSSNESRGMFGAGCAAAAAAGPAAAAAAAGSVLRFNVAGSAGDLAGKGLAGELAGYSAMGSPKGLPKYSSTGKGVLNPVLMDMGTMSRRLWLLAWPLSWMEVLTFTKELIITSYVGHLGAAELSALVLAQTVYNVTGNAP
uniref:Uncharacterized protein n=1 Tax=Tetradesmus obliquus TaxID=3088 RepID=A0A383VXR6_TETOB